MGAVESLAFVWHLEDQGRECCETMRTPDGFVSRDLLLKVKTIPSHSILPSLVV